MTSLALLVHLKASSHVTPGPPNDHDRGVRGLAAEISLLAASACSVASLSTVSSGSALVQGLARVLRGY